MCIIDAAGEINPHIWFDFATVQACVFALRPADSRFMAAVCNFGNDEGFYIVFFGFPCIGIAHGESLIVCCETHPPAYRV